MTAMPDVDKVAKVNLTYSDGVAEFGSRFFVSWPSGSPSIANCNTYAGQIGSAWAAHIAGQVINTVSLVRVDVEDLTSHTANAGDDTTAHAGTLSGAACPNNVTFDIQFLIPNRYRGGHPLIHMPGPGASELETMRTWTSGTLSSYASAWAAFMASVTGVATGAFTDVLHVSLHGYRNPPPSGGVDVRFVTGYRMRQTVGTQRRRARALR